MLLTKCKQGKKLNGGHKHDKWKLGHNNYYRGLVPPKGRSCIIELQDVPKENVQQRKAEEERERIFEL